MTRLRRFAIGLIKALPSPRPCAIWPGTRAGLPASPPASPRHSMGYRSCPDTGIIGHSTRPEAGSTVRNARIRRRAIRYVPKKARGHMLVNRRRPARKIRTNLPWGRVALALPNSPHLRPCGRGYIILVGWCPIPLRKASHSISQHSWKSYNYPRLERSDTTRITL